MRKSYCTYETSRLQTTMLQTAAHTSLSCERDVASRLMAGSQYSRSRQHGPNLCRTGGACFSLPSRPSGALDRPISR